MHCVNDWVWWDAGWVAGKKEGWGSRWTDSVTSTWSWSPTWEVQGISWGRAWKGRGAGGWAWAATGGRTGSQTRFWLVSHSPSGWQAVTDAAPLLGTLSHLIGNSAKPSWARISESSSSYILYRVWILSVLFYQFSFWLLFYTIMLGMWIGRNGSESLLAYLWFRDLLILFCNIIIIIIFILSINIQIHYITQ